MKALIAMVLLTYMASVICGIVWVNTVWTAPGHALEPIDADALSPLTPQRFEGWPTLAAPTT